jgi:hypothetical protein
VDGTRKWAEEGYRREWPEVCRMSDDVVARVDAMWDGLGIGSARAHVNGANGTAPTSAARRILLAARELLAKGGG